MGRSLFPLALAALVLAPALGESLAQVGVVRATLTVAVEDPGRALVPGRDEPLNVIINYNPQAGAIPAPGPDPLSNENDSQPTRISLEAKAFPTWVENVTFDPPIVEVRALYGGGNTNAPAVALVRVKPDAPALQREDFIITGTAEPNGNIDRATAESPPIKLRGAFIARVNVTAPAAQIVPGGRWTEMPFTIANVGNAETKVELNVTARPQESEVDYPKSVTIARGASETVNVRLRLPWTFGETGIVELTAIPLTDQEEGRPARAEIEVFGQSAAPAASLPFALVALAALALARRR